LGGDVAVCCNRPTLTRLLHTTGLDRIVAVTDSIEAAAAALRANEPQANTN
jgi:anti-anti-sigma regulatory factor